MPFPLGEMVSGGFEAADGGAKRKLRGAPKYIQTTFTSQIEGNREAPLRALCERASAKDKLILKWRERGERRGERVGGIDRGLGGSEEGATEVAAERSGSHAAFDNYSNYGEKSIGTPTKSRQPSLPSSLPISLSLFRECRPRA